MVHSYDLVEFNVNWIQLYVDRPFVQQCCTFQHTLLNAEFSMGMLPLEYQTLIKVKLSLPVSKKREKSFNFYSIIGGQASYNLPLLLQSNISAIDKTRAEVYLGR